MRRAFRRAGWALAAACGVSVVPFAIVQAGAQTPAQTSPRAASAAEVGVHRAAEIKVELAWLEDEATFPCSIGAEATPSGLEVRGFVPSQAVRQKALEIAHKASGLPAVDYLHVDPSVAQFRPARTKEQLRLTIAACLHAGFGAQLDKIHASCNDNGVVTLRGEVANLDDKISISKHLQSVRGISCVHNLLELPGSSVEQSRPPVTISAKRDVKTPEPPRTAVTAPEAPAPLRPMPSSPLVSKTADAVKVPEPRVVQVPPPPVPVSSASSGAAKDAQGWPTVPTMPAVSVPAPKSDAAVSGLPPLPSAPLMVAAEPAPKTATRKEPPSESYVTTGVVLMNDSPATLPPIPTPPPVVSTNRKIESGAEAYITTGTVTMSDEPTAPPAPPISSVTTPAAVKRAVEVACGPRASGIEVSFEANNRVVVRLTASTSSDSDECCRRIQAIQVLQPYRVDLKIQLQH